MPDDVAEEKVKALLALGAHVERVRPASIVDKKQVRPILSNLCHSGRLKLRFHNLLVCCEYSGLATADLKLDCRPALLTSLEPSS